MMYSLLFFLAGICSTVKIKLISAQRNNLMQQPNSSIASGWNWDGIADDAETINVTIALKKFLIYYSGGQTTCLK